MSAPLFQIIAWGPSYRQPRSAHVTVELLDPTRVVLPGGRARFEIREAGTIFLYAGPHYSYVVNHAIDQRLCDYLMQHYGDEIKQRMQDAPFVADCRTITPRLEAWVFAGLTLCYFPSTNGTTPSGAPYFERDGVLIAGEAPGRLEKHPGKPLRRHQRG